MINAYAPPFSSAPGDSSSEGYSGAAARADHKHGREAAVNYAPTGSVTMFAGSSAPTDWLLCDGSAVSRTTFAALFAVLGTTYGVGDGSTTFNLPDMRGRTGVAPDGGTGRVSANNTLAASSGEQSHALTTAELAAHNHGITDPNHSHTISGYMAGHSHSLSGNGAAQVFASASVAKFVMAQSATSGWTSSRSATVSAAAATDTSFTGTTIGATLTGNTDANNATSSGSTGSAATSVTTNNNGSGTAHNNMQPYLVLNYIVKT